MTDDQLTTEPAGPAGLPDLADLARGTSSQTRAYFHMLGERQIEETRTNYRVHWLQTDANGRDRTAALARHLYFRIAEYCIPRSKLNDARELDDTEGGSMHMMSLQEEARRMFLDSDTSGEGGELLLYFLLEAELRIPQILCKMPLKTNEDMPIHGVDGVHASALPNGNLAVYWGESKLYADLQSALTSCFSSITPFLLDEGGGDAHRDLVLARNNLDPGDRALQLRLVKYFTDDEPERNSLEVRGACLVAFTHDHFASPFAEGTDALLDEVQERIDSWAASVRSRVTFRSIESFEIEFFCVPLPSVQRLRDEFQALLGHA